MSNKEHLQESNIHTKLMCEVIWQLKPTASMCSCTTEADSDPLWKEEEGINGSYFIITPVSSFNIKSRIILWSGSHLHQALVFDSVHEQNKKWVSIRVDNLYEIYIKTPDFPRPLDEDQLISLYKMLPRALLKLESLVEAGLVRETQHCAPLTWNTGDDNSLLSSQRQFPIWAGGYARHCAIHRIDCD